MNQSLPPPVLGWGRLMVDRIRAEQMVGASAARKLSKRTSVYLDVARKSFPMQTANAYGIGFAHAF